VQLRANVLHLQSQIVLAKSLLQLKDPTIQAQNTEIELLKGKIDLGTFFERTKNRQDETSSEPLIKRVVSVRKCELKFLEFDFPAPTKAKTNVLTLTYGQGSTAREISTSRPLAEVWYPLVS
jgi:hypothetical protein